MMYGRCAIIRKSVLFGFWQTAVNFMREKTIFCFAKKQSKAKLAAEDITGKFICFPFLAWNI